MARFVSLFDRLFESVVARSELLGVTRPLLGELEEGSRAVSTGRGGAPAISNMFTEVGMD